MKNPRLVRREWAAVLPWAIALAAACAGFVAPPGPVSPDRPGYTDTPPALPAGATELELGYTDDRVDSQHYRTIGEALFRVGVGASTELRLFGNSYATRSVRGLPDVSGMEDPKFGVKTNLRSIPDSVHSLVPNIAALAAVTLPLGAAAFSGVHAQPEAKLAINWTTPSPLSVYSNIGVGGAYDGSEWGERGWYSLALWYAVNPRVSLLGEGIALRSIGGSALPSNAADAGITYLINDRFQVDFRAGLGLGPTSGSEHFFGVGLARRW